MRGPICDHTTAGHARALAEAAQGALRTCPTCGAVPVKRRAYWEWSPPSQKWVEAQKVDHPGWEVDRIEGDWSRPRVIPWLRPTHPNYRVTSPKEALRVCREWGIDPERGFISPAHQARADAAADRNFRAGVAKLTAQQRAMIRRARAKSSGKSA